MATSPEPSGLSRFSRPAWLGVKMTRISAASHRGGGRELSSHALRPLQWISIHAVVTSQIIDRTPLEMQSMERSKQHSKNRTLREFHE